MGFTPTATATNILWIAPISVHRPSVEPVSTWDRTVRSGGRNAIGAPGYVEIGRALIAMVVKDLIQRDTALQNNPIFRPLP